MTHATLRALEFDRIVDVVRSFAATPLGAEALDDLWPQSDPRQVQATLAATTEGVRYLDANGAFALDGPPDLDDIVAALVVEGRVLEPLQLHGVARFLASVESTRAAVAQAGGGPYPAIRTIMAAARSFDHEVAAIRAAIDAQGDVVDTATPQLRAIRDRLRKQRQRLRSTLESYLRGRETAKYLQEQVVTERNGRFVLVVRAEHRSAIPGIVHGSSGSGASLFLEPLSTVDINNDIVALEDDEAHEIHRILLGLANALRKRALDLRHTLTAATELDVLQARARFSRLVAGIEPTVTPDVRLALPAARHPLLMAAVRARAGVDDPPGAPPPGTEAGDGGGAAGGSSRAPAADVSPSEPVPVDIHVEPPAGALIVTGPNTGGKTVALKTAGLLVAMAQAGLLIPAGRDAVVPVCRTIFADIGDDQSIASSLSTFSGHITNLVQMDRRLALPALVLLDEVGAGTDPVEGGALGAAVIDHFRRRGALVIATTHDDLLKSYAVTTEGVIGAGFGFDGTTYAPTYRLEYGAPGRSLALEIAGRLGLDRAIIDDARRRRSDREAQLAQHLEQMERDLRTLDAERATLATARAELDRTRRDLDTQRQALATQEEDARQRLRAGVDREVKAARDAAQTIIDRLQREVAELTRRAAAAGPTRPRLSTGDTGTVKRKALDALDAVRTTAAPTPARRPTPPRRPAVTPVAGNHVRIVSLGLTGTVVAVHGRDAEVESRGKRIRVRLRDLDVQSPPAEQPRGGVTLAVGADEVLPLELNVVGCRVDDALTRVERYVDQAMLQERRELRIIHGHGTGQLRRAIAGYLKEHPVVVACAPAPPEQGGGGVTVVKLEP